MKGGREGGKEGGEEGQTDFNEGALLAEAHKAFRLF